VTYGVLSHQSHQVHENVQLCSSVERFPAASQARDFRHVESLVAHAIDFVAVERVEGQTQSGRRAPGSPCR